MIPAYANQNAKHFIVFIVKVLINAAKWHTHQFTCNKATTTQNDVNSS